MLVKYRSYLFVAMLIGVGLAIGGFVRNVDKVTVPGLIVTLGVITLCIVFENIDEYKNRLS